MVSSFGHFRSRSSCYILQIIEAFRQQYPGKIKNFVSPYFRLGFPPDEIYLMDAAERRVAEISEDIFNELTYKTEIAPIRYENALKAHFGFQEWKEEDYDKILYKHTLKSHEIARKVISDLIVPESD